jgi:hypothetical protein
MKTTFSITTPYHFYFHIIESQQLFLVDYTMSDNDDDMPPPLEYPSDDECEEPVVSAPPMCQLFGHQVNMIDFAMSHYRNGKKGAILGAECGLGKTIAALTLMERIQSTQQQKQHMLIIVTLATLQQWQHEWTVQMKRDPSVIHVYYGPNRSIPACSSSSSSKIILTTRSTIMVDFQKQRRALFDTRFDVAVIDEGHELFNMHSSMSRTASQVPLYEKWYAALHFQFALVLTGTPISHKRQNNGSLVRLLRHPWTLDDDKDDVSFQRFFREYCMVVTRNDLDESMQRRYPRVEFRTVIVPLSERIRSQHTTRWGEYQTVCALMSNARGSGGPCSPALLTRMHALASSLRMMELDGVVSSSSAASQTETSVKSEWIKNELKRLSVDRSRLGRTRRVVVCSEFVFVLKQWAIDLASIATCWLFTGDESPKQRRVILHDFLNDDDDDDDDELRVLLLSKRAGGSGLSIPRTYHMYIMEPSFTSLVDQQLTGRVTRMGTMDVSSTPVAITMVVCGNASSSSSSSCYTSSSTIESLLRERQVNHILDMCLYIPSMRSTALHMFGLSMVEKVERDRSKKKATLTTTTTTTTVDKKKVGNIKKRPRPSPIESVPPPPTPKTKPSMHQSPKTTTLLQRAHMLITKQQASRTIGLGLLKRKKIM